MRLASMEKGSGFFGDAKTSIQGHDGVNGKFGKSRGKFHRDEMLKNGGVFGVFDLGQTMLWGGV